MKSCLLRFLPFAAVCSLFLHNASAAPDSVDTGFASGAGSVFDATDFGSISSILIQDDGKIVFGSNEMAATIGGVPKQVPLIRFNPDGTVDEDFFADNDPDGAGTGIIFPNSGWPEVHALARQDDGKLIAAGVMEGMDDGTTQVGSRSIVRINTDGTPDETYQTEGTIQWLIGNLNYIEDIHLQPDQKLIVAGGFRGIRDKGAPSWTSRHGLARLNQDGTVDTSFAIDPYEFGVPAEEVYPRGWFRQAVVDTAGRIYVVGQFEYGGSFSPTILPVFARLRPDGSRDASFQPAVPASVALYKGLALDSEGRVLFLGDIDNPATDSYLARYHPDGTMDGSFSPPSLGVVDARPLRIDPQGRVFLAQNDDTLIRLNADGSLDPSFNAVSTYSEFGKSPFFSHWMTSPEGKVYSGAYFDAVEGVSTVKLVAFEGDATAPNAGELRFVFSSAEIIENGGTLHVPVERTGGRTGAVSIQYSTTTGTAGGADFTSASGTLDWADGVAGIRYIEIPVLQDTETEGEESFTVSLSSPTGAPLAGASSITATILDDDDVPVILEQPAAAAVPEGATASFSVAVDSPVAVTYQWRKDGVDIAGATGATFAVTAVEEADEGQYSVVVTNPNLPGSPVASDPAGLTVIPPAVTVDTAFSADSSTLPNSFVPGPNGTVFINSGNFSVGFTLIKLAADGSADPGFTAPAISYEFANSGNSVQPHPLPDGKVLITGTFEAVDGQPRFGIARLNADGSLDASFDPPSTDTREIRGVAVLPSGEVYAAYKPLNQSGGLRRFMNDGSFDPDFSSDLTDGTSGFLYAMAEMPDGSLLVSHATGGSFSGFTRGIARLNAGSGAAVGAFAPIEDLTSEADPLISLPDGRFAAIHYDEVKLYLPDGTEDPDFSLSAGFSGEINGMVYNNGRLIVAGPASYGSNPIQGLARFALDGTVDENFPGGSGPSSDVREIGLDSDGRLLAQGYFSSWNGTSVNQLARLLFTAPEAGFAVTGLEPREDVGSFTVVVDRYGDAGEPASVRLTSSDGTAVSPGDYAAVDTVLSWPAGDDTARETTIPLVDDANMDGDLSFTLALTEASGLRLFNDTATVTIKDDDSLPVITNQPTATDGIIGESTSFSVTASSPTAESYQWYLDGATIDGATSPTLTIDPITGDDAGAYTVVVTNNYASVTSDPAVLTAVENPASITSEFVDANLNGRVTDIAPLPNGGAVIVGFFTDAGGISGQNYVARINADGSVDPTFSAPDILDFSVWIKSVLVQQDGKILLGGTFTLKLDESTWVRHIARLNADGTPDLPFMTNVLNAVGFSDEIEALALLPDGKIAVGGEFELWSGNSLGSGNLVRLNPDGTLDGAYAAPGGIRGTVQSILPLPDGSLLANRQRYNSDLTHDTEVYSQFPSDLALHPDGDYLWPRGSTMEKVGPDGVVRWTSPNVDWQTAVAQNNGKILVGGEKSNGPYIERYLADGADDTTFFTGTGFNGTVYAIAIGDTGRIWIGGQFSSYDGTPATNLAILNGDPVVEEPDPLLTFLEDAGIPEGQREAGMDFEKDGLPNVIEFLYNLDPTGPDAGFSWNGGMASSSGSNLNALAGTTLFGESEQYFSLPVLLPTDLPDGYGIEVLASTDLSAFGPSSLNVVSVGTPTPHTPGFAWQTYVITTPITSGSPAFIRMEVNTGL